MSDNSFVKSAKKMTDPVEILNWYRNLYYKEPDATEAGIVARALNDILPELVALREEKMKEGKNVKNNELRGHITTSERNAAEFLSKKLETDVSADDIYIFTITLASNVIDGFFERFNDKTLEKLMPMFVGMHCNTDIAFLPKHLRPVIYDTFIHPHHGEMITPTECHNELKACVAVLRNEETEPLIKRIESGEEKYLSISCSCRYAICSICGEEYKYCIHTKGRKYGVDTCHAVFIDPTDAYETDIQFVDKKAPVAPGTKITTKGQKARIEELENECDALRTRLAFTQTEQKWISVKERLPEQEYCDYVKLYPDSTPEFIVLIEGALVPTALIFDGHDFFGYEEGGNCTVYNVSHWMKLPLPPKGE